MRPEAAAAIQALFDDDIPLTRAMGLRVEALDADGIRIGAPLAPNVNDKGTAFGGSLAAMLTLAGWGWLTACCSEAGMDCDLVIHRGEIEYLLPVGGPLVSTCAAPRRDEWDAFEARFRSRGRARIAMAPRILDGEGREAVRFDCEYVAMRREKT